MMRLRAAVALLLLARCAHAFLMQAFPAMRRPAVAARARAARPRLCTARMSVGKSVDGSRTVDGSGSFDPVRVVSPNDDGYATATPTAVFLRPCAPCRAHAPSLKTAWSPGRPHRSTSLLWVLPADASPPDDGTKSVSLLPGACMRCGCASRVRVWVEVRV